MNADFEAELFHTYGAYCRLPFFDILNRCLAPHLLWLARPGDALLLPPESSSEQLRAAAQRRGVELILTTQAKEQPVRTFTPWGWTPSAVALGEKVGAITQPIPFDVVRRVNSKLWSHRLETELGIAQTGAATADTFEELQAAVARARPKPDDKWVIKSPFGFAARDRVLGRGSFLDEPQAKWCRRRFAQGETLIFQPWLDVIREYGIVMEISSEGVIEIHGVSDLQTNGAGTGKGYLLGRPPVPHRAIELERIARVVGERLFKEGYNGPVGIDALEHPGGLHPLLEINARYTMGFIALTVERSLKPATPTFWSTSEEKCTR